MHVDGEFANPLEPIGIDGYGGEAAEAHGAKFLTSFWIDAHTHG